MNKAISVDIKVFINLLLLLYLFINMYIDSGADLDHATSATMGSDATHTTLNLENGHSKYFKVGDLIRIENEICEVTAVGTGADLAIVPAQLKEAYLALLLLLMQTMLLSGCHFLT